MLSNARLFVLGWIHQTTASYDVLSADAASFIVFCQSHRRFGADSGHWRMYVLSCCFLDEEVKYNNFPSESPNDASTSSIQKFLLHIHSDLNLRLNERLPSFPVSSVRILSKIFVQFRPDCFPAPDARIMPWRLHNCFFHIFPPLQYLLVHHHTAPHYVKYIQKLLKVDSKWKLALCLCRCSIKRWLSTAWLWTILISLHLDVLSPAFNPLHNA